MPVTNLDKKTALVLVDLQKSITGRQVEPNTARYVINNAAALVKAFRKAGLPIVIVNVTPPEKPLSLRTELKMPVVQFQKEWAEIVPEIEMQDTDIRITKHTWNAFHNTTLDEELREIGVTGIVLAGIATSIGVEGTARGAWERGFNITFAIDAMTDLNAKAHENSLNIIFPRIGEIDTVRAIIEIVASNIFSIGS